jgi:hypothetical protein
MLANAGAPAVLAGAPDAVMLADAGAPAVLAGAPLAVMLADAGAPAVLAPAPLSVMLADVAPVPLAVMIADAGALQSLHLLLRLGRWCCPTQATWQQRRQAHRGQGTQHAAG